MSLLRFALQCLIALLLLGMVIGFFGETGPAEKVLLAAFAVVLVFAASRVRRLGHNPAAV
jgi:hypothetical protein